MIKIALFVHVYYTDSWDSFICDNLKKIHRPGFYYFFNLCNSLNTSGLSARIKESFPDAYIITTPNKGKDIGGKLALMDLYLSTSVSTDFIILLHDKKSPHSLNGDLWRERLFKIIHPEYVNIIIKMFSKEPKIGLIGAKEFIMNEYDKGKKKYESLNNDKLMQLFHKYNIHTKDFRFIGGTMFWVRTTIFSDFFKRVPPLECRKMLEPGNITDMDQGTYTHSWERLFCHIATSRFKLKGV